MLTSAELITGWRGGTRLAAAGTLALLIALAAGCESSDPTAPEGSMITVSADPQTVLPGQNTAITATLRSSNGTRLPDQELIFNTTVGTLAPPAQTGILTDDDGQAVSVLTTPSSATVTATSGSISGSTSVTVSGCALAGLTLNLTLDEIDDCVTSVDLTVTALDTNGDPCEDLIVRIQALNPATAGRTKLPGSLSPSQGLTDIDGEFMATFTPSQSACETSCDTAVDPNAPNSGQCEVDFQAEDSSGAIKSFRETLSETIP